jgi:hypothetical protein
MASDNPFDPNYSKGLLAFLTDPAPAKPTNALADLASTPEMGGLFGALSPPSSLNPFSLAAHQLFATPSPQPPANPFSNLGAVADLFPPSKPASPFGSLAAAALYPERQPTNSLSGAP